MKRFLSIGIISNIILHIYAPLIALGDDTKQEKTFIVTAYYSPLPDQSFYLRGNYEDEIMLNGEWTRGASGMKVFPGMLAAPDIYPFGTKIELEWIGMWVVEDRWWAIVDAGKRGYDSDRIDVWMGYGEQWLRKALNWGKRKIRWVVYGKINTPASIDLSSLSTGINLPKTNTTIDIFSDWIGKYSTHEEIKSLQKFLKGIGLYQWDIDGTYNISLVNSLYSFQKEHEIVSTPDDIWAGYWWVKTRKAIQETYKTNATISKETKKEFELFSTAISPTSPEEHIKALQNFFTNIAYYDGDITGKYNDIYDTIVNYQIEKNIIQDKNDSVAGYWWPKTREQAKKDNDAYIEKKRAEEAFVKKMEDMKLKSLASAEESINLIWDIKKWDTSSWVRELQRNLKKLWFFEGNSTAIFGDKTQEAILKYQVSKGLIQQPTDIWAGKVWPKTKETLQSDLANLILQEQLWQNQVAMK